VDDGQTKLPSHEMVFARRGTPAARASPYGSRSLQARQWSALSPTRVHGRDLDPIIAQPERSRVI
jgi:hypothetical protein